jgi:hypothetical protein
VERAYAADVVPFVEPRDSTRPARPPRLDPRWVAALGMALVVGSAAMPARAQPVEANDDETRAVCRRAYESSQLRRRDHQLIEARQEMRVCGAEGCPAIVSKDCVQWLGQVEAGIPSLVFEALSDAGAIFDVTARIDGAVVATGFDGRPIEVDPGLHKVTFERQGSPVLEQRIILREGEKNRLVVADWTTPKLPERGPTGRAERPVPLAVLLTAGMAALGFVDFAVAATLGDSLKSDLEASACAPFCPRDKVDALRARYVIADIGLTVGVADLAASAVLFLMRPERARTRAWIPIPVQRAAAGSLVVGPTCAGAFVAWRGAF